MYLSGFRWDRFDHKVSPNCYTELTAKAFKIVSDSTTLNKALKNVNAQPSFQLQSLWSNNLFRGSGLPLLAVWKASALSQQYTCLMSDTFFEF